MPWAWLIFGLSLLAGLVMVFVSSRHSLALSDFDPYQFGEIGKSIASGHGFAGFGVLIQRRAPLYPAVIGAMYAVFGVHPYLFLVIQCVMFAGTCTIVFDIGRRVFNERTGIIAGVLCALHPVMLRYIPYLHLETLLTLLVTLLIWSMVRFYEKPSVGWGLLVGFIGGAAALTKAVILLFPPLFVVGVILANRHSSRRAAQGSSGPLGRSQVKLAAVLLTLGLTILPWTVRQYRSSGHFVLISTGTSDAFLRGFVFSRTEFITLRKPPYTDAENESNAYFKGLARKAGTTWQRNDWETDRMLNREAKRRLLAQPGQVARKTVVGVFTFWYELTSFKNSLLALVLAVGAWFLAIIGWRRARREGRASWLLLLPVLYLNIGLALLLALGRYSVPILPALIVLSAFGFDSLLDKWQERRSASTAAAQGTPVPL
jgi:4-amino-4-deoxy-L-arabinose transferase-like glycosyltransferase